MAVVDVIVVVVTVSVDIVLIIVVFPRNLWLSSLRRRQELLSSARECIAALHANQTRQHAAT